MHMLEYFVVVIVAVLSAYLDWTKKIIPNWVSLGGIVAGSLLSIFEARLDVALIGFLSACTVVVPYLKGWLGGGDVKLLMAYGTLLGAWHLLDLWIGAALLSIFFVLASAYRKRISFRHIGVPYAVPLAMMSLWIVGRGFWYP